MLCLRCWSSAWTSTDIFVSPVTLRFSTMEDLRDTRGIDVGHLAFKRKPTVPTKVGKSSIFPKQWVTHFRRGVFYELVQLDQCTNRCGIEFAMLHEKLRLDDLCSIFCGYDDSRSQILFFPTASTSTEFESNLKPLFFHTLKTVLHDAIKCMIFFWNLSRDLLWWPKDNYCIIYEANFEDCKTTFKSMQIILLAL